MTRDEWEEGFDAWTPPRSTSTGPDGADADRAALLRLARDLAEQRQAEHVRATVELEQLKRALRERAEAVAARERELAELQRRLGKGEAPRLRRQKQTDAVSTEALVARERAALERAHALDARERELRARQAELAAEAARMSEREQELAAELAAANARRDGREPGREPSAAERELAEMSRELDALQERERAVRRREVAGVPPGLDAPLVPPSFSEGLASFVRGRSRGDAR